MTASTAKAPHGEVWLIAGPTASGKSALALALAERTGGELINADSMQLYRDLRVLSARPSAEDEARAPHHLFGVADGAEAWSVGRWSRAVEPLLRAIAARGRPAIVVGGTGLYFRALTHGLAKVPDAPREGAEARFDGQGEAAFRTALRARDPEAEARIAPGDRQRLIRALAVAETGTPLSRLQGETRPTLFPGSWRGVVLEPPRAELYARCDLRLRAMAGSGALEEVRDLAARGLDAGLPVMKALGVREFAAVVRGETTLDSALEQAAMRTRNYAKRQSTWFRNQTPDWPRLVKPDVDALLAVAPSPEKRQIG